MGNSHPTPPHPKFSLLHPSQRAAPRGQEELPARPLSVQVSRPSSGSGGQAPGEALRPRIGQGLEEDWKTGWEEGAQISLEALGNRGAEVLECGEASESKGSKRIKKGRRRVLRKLCLLGRARRLDRLAGSWAPGTRLGCLLGLGGAQVSACS